MSEKYKVKFSGKTTTRRIRIYCDGEHVGYIFHSTTNTRKFIVELNGIYYAADGRIRVNGGGSMCKWFPTLTQARSYAVMILQWVTVRPYEEPKVTDGGKKRIPLRMCLRENKVTISRRRVRAS